MRFLLEHKRWKRVKKQLRSQGLVRLPKTEKSGGVSWHNYTLPLNPPAYYPRVHLISSHGGSHDLRLIEVHVDIVPHTHTEIFHPAVEMVKNLIRGTK